jgi:hypothetical protein
MIDRPGQPIPVALGEPIYGAASDFIKRPPVVHVHLGADPHWSPESTQPLRHSRTTYVALIDTGADAVAIRPAVAAAIGAQPNGSAIAHGMGKSHSGIRIAAIQIIFPTIGIAFQAPDALIIELPGSARSFDVILGRKFLRHCRLTVDGPNAGYLLEWVG